MKTGEVSCLYLVHCKPAWSPGQDRGGELSLLCCADAVRESIDMIPSNGVRLMEFDTFLQISLFVEMLCFPFDTVKHTDLSTTHRVV